MRKSGLIIVSVLILLAGGIYFLVTSGRLPNPFVKKSLAPSLGGQIYTQSKNPLEGKIPETNPFSVETNPARSVYPNPFDRL